MSNQFTPFLAIVTLSITFNYWLKVLARVLNDVENPLKFPVCFHGAVPGFFVALFMLSLMTHENVPGKFMYFLWNFKDP